MNSINIYWGPDTVFEQATSGITEPTYLQDVLTHIGRAEIIIPGLTRNDEDSKPMEVEDLLIFTDDYGALREWALLGFTKNVLENLKVHINNIWLNNPPQPIYDDILRNNQEKIIKEHHRSYPELTDDSLRKMVSTYTENVIGQDHVMKNVATALYSLRQKERQRPVTLLFLGGSGVGKTETAKFIGFCMEQEMVRIQFSMQQTVHAYQFIFGADHGENSFARELIRRKSNLILLDEFDKVSPAFYNAFYQMFDEGLFFPETTREFFEYMKASEAPELITDIAVSDEDFQKIELHASIIEVATIIIKRCHMGSQLELMDHYIISFDDRSPRRAWANKW